MGCVPLIIQHGDVSDTEADQAFEDLLPYANFSLRLRKEDIPQLPQILRDFPRETWLQSCSYGATSAASGRASCGSARRSRSSSAAAVAA